MDDLVMSKERQQANFKFRQLQHQDFNPVMNNLLENERTQRSDPKPKVKFVDDIEYCVDLKTTQALRNSDLRTPSNLQQRLNEQTRKKIHQIYSKEVTHDENGLVVPSYKKQKDAMIILRYE